MSFDRLNQTSLVRVLLLFGRRVILGEEKRLLLLGVEGLFSFLASHVAGRRRVFLLKRQVIDFRAHTLLVGLSRAVVLQVVAYRFGKIVFSVFFLRGRSILVRGN